MQNSTPMRQIVYTMHFRGQAVPAGTDPKVLRATTSATSCTVTTKIELSGLNTEVKASEGELAFLESQLHLVGPDSFREDGSITFGEDAEHILQFSTIGEGHFTSSPEPGTIAGTASWRIEGGKGQFARASGFITSTFVLTQSGDLSDVQSGLIFLPD